MADEIEVYPITEVRTCTVRTDPDSIVLIVKSGSDTRHYQMQIGEFAKLAERLKQDAMLLVQDQNYNG